MKKENLWILFIFFFSIISLIMNIVNGRFEMVDFEVYYRAAERILSGSELYGIKEDGHYVFKYAPNAGIYFIPFLLTKLSFAKYIYWFFLTTLFYFGVKTWYALITHSLDYSISNRKKNWIILLSILSVLTHVHMELHLGQVNLLLLVFYLLLIKYMYQRQTLLFSFVLSISIYIKPFGLIFFPYLLAKKEYKKIAISFLFLLALGILPLFFYPSFSSFSNLYSNWWNELIIELNTKQDLLADYNHTIFSVLARFTPIKYILINNSARIIYQLTLLTVIGLGMLKYIRYSDGTRTIITEMLILIALIPLLAFTNDNAFIFEFPLIMYIIFHVDKLNTKGKILLICGCLLIGGNIYDIVGKDIMLFLSSISIYTFGTIILLCLLFYELKKRK